MTTQHGVALILIFASAVAWPGDALAAEASAGKAVFRSQCAACHSALPSRSMVGPTLFGVVGRVSGSVPGFHYSEANKSAGITWSTETLDQYLIAPRDMVPGTSMSYPGLSDDDQRSALVAYLAALH